MNQIAHLIDRKLWLAPLAGFTDQPFRSICKELGADVLVTEMVSADGIVYNMEKCMPYIRFDEAQRPIGIQLFGSDPRMMKHAATLLLPFKPDFIDLNMGCPVKKVVKRNAGSALMKDTKRAAEIVRQIKDALPHIPVSVKIRAGWDKDSINYLDFGKAMQDAGADFICLHPRTRSQFFAGESDWDMIKNLKQHLKVPVIGNGDILDEHDALRMFELTGCDSVMIGRGVRGNPWIFRKVRALLDKVGYVEPSAEEKLLTIKRHFERSLQYRGKEYGVKEMRGHFSYYTKGMPGGNKARDFINRCSDPEIILQKLSSLLVQNYTIEDQ